jgi:hypothetical protein
MINFNNIPSEHISIYSTFVTRAMYLIEKGYFVNCDAEELAQCMYSNYLTISNKNTDLININT